MDYNFYLRTNYEIDRHFRLSQFDLASTRIQSSFILNDEKKKFSIQDQNPITPVEKFFSSYRHKKFI